MVKPRRESLGHGTETASVVAVAQSASNAGRSALRKAEARGSPGGAGRDTNRCPCRWPWTIVAVRMRGVRARSAPAAATRRAALTNPCCTHPPFAAPKTHGSRRPSLPVGQTAESPRAAVVASDLGAPPLVRRCARGGALSRATHLSAHAPVAHLADFALPAFFGGLGVGRSSIRITVAPTPIGKVRKRGDRLQPSKAI